ncbi:hypothetical protein BDY19DRAFT_1036112 [Irpex rosettiformis]|uniref:Uncharacterized protein n=1 Tax=Irpex rosettiformis TaxID=378272 RepID=A0ACB8U7L9_9APHY|nr:hypothetical protein BDY19DRAFT_1036112 [Irpex rosettiformis]
MVDSSHNEYVADSEDEDLLVGPSSDVLNTSLPAHSIQTPDTSIDISTGAAPHIPSLPPIAVLPQASASSNSPSEVASSGHNHTKPSASPPQHITEHALSTKGLLAPTAAVSNESSSEPTKPRPRPKPRPVRKIHAPADPTDSSLLNPPLIAAHATASTTKLPRLAPLLPAIVPEFVGDIAERTKMRSRIKTTKAGQKRKSITSDVVELTSDSEDEMSLLPSAKSRTKGKAKETIPKSIPRRSAKRLKVSDDSDAPPSTLNTLPVTTSELTHLSSQLPPSDPPFSSSYVPPISCPRAVSSPPSSPIPRVPSRKRKRLGVPYSDDDEPSHADDKDSQKLMPPPPPRLAPTTAESSRSLPPTTSTSAEAGPSSDKGISSKTKSKGRRSKVADETENWTELSKPEGKGRKSVADDDDIWTDKPKSKPARKNQRKKDTATHVEGADTTGNGAKGRERGKGKGRQTEQPMIMEVVVSPLKRSSPQKPSHNPDEEREPSMVIDASTTMQDNFSVEIRRGMPGDVRERTPEPSTAISRWEGNKQEGKGKERAKKRAILSSDEEDSDSSLTAAKTEEKQENNMRESSHNTPRIANVTPPRGPLSTAASISRSSLMIPKTTSTPMAELIRRANSKPSSPFATSRSGYSTFAKSSKSMLRRIAPLHPNRRTPPPPPPRPPPPKKTKKQLEMEEQWELELEESVEGWFAMSDEERAALRRAKRDAVFGYDD